MTEKTLTTENIKPALDALRGELAPWPVVAMKQDRLNDTQKSAVNSGITSSLVAQIIANTAAIRALESAITGTGLRPLVVASLPAIGTQGILYIVPVTTYDPETDADVVNYSNEYIWIVAPDAPVTEGYYEQVGQTGIVINNGQLTITVNGTSVGTFTANQSGNTTAAITVPTNADYVDKTTAQTAAGVKTFSDGIVSNVTGNVTGDLTGTASKAIADEDGTSIKTGYVNVAGNQTVSGQKTWSGNAFYTAGAYHRNNSYEIGNTPASNTVIPIYFADKVNANTGYVRNVILTTGKTQSELLARNKFTNGALSPTGTDVSSTLQVEVQSNGDKTLYFDGSIRNNVLPYATNTYTLGSSSYQWSSVYAQSYFYNGTQWGLDRNNTWTGSNTFTQSVISNSGLWAKFTNLQAKDQSSLTSSQVKKIGVDSSDGKSFTKSEFIVASTYTRTAFCANYYNTSGTIAYDFVINQDVDNQGNKSFYPSVSGVAELGTSTNKWKTLNGVNPGALSLPNYANYVDITSNMSSATLDGTTPIDINDYLPNMTGWLNVVIADTTGDYIFATQGKSGAASGFNASRSFHTGASAGGYIVLFIPIVAGLWHSLFVKASSLTQVRFYPCLGNV